MRTRSVRSSILAVLALIVAGLTVGCGSTSDPEPPFAVTSTVLAQPTGENVAVFAPEGEGSWPVVYALHGLGSEWQRLEGTASELASHGTVVFAPNYDASGVPQGPDSAECGYRFARSIAEDYGGDVDQPIAIVGHSAGASWGLAIGLDDPRYGPAGTYDACLTGVPRPQVVVSIGGCHYQVGDREVDFDPAGWGWQNQQASLVLVAGTEDTKCAPWQSEDASAALELADYNVELVEIAGADHSSLVFPVADEETVHAILDAIAAADG
jgi:dienelactone hydrolase